MHYISILVQHAVHTGDLAGSCCLIHWIDPCETCSGRGPHKRWACPKCRVCTCRQKRRHSITKETSWRRKFLFSPFEPGARKLANQWNREIVFYYSRRILFMNFIVNEKRIPRMLQKLFFVLTVWGWRSWSCAHCGDDFLCSAEALCCGRMEEDGVQDQSLHCLSNNSNHIYYSRGLNLIKSLGIKPGVVFLSNVGPSFWSGINLILNFIFFIHTELLFIIRFLRFLIAGGFIKFVCFYFLFFGSKEATSRFSVRLLLLRFLRITGFNHFIKMFLLLLFCVSCMQIFGRFADQLVDVGEKKSK